MRDLGNIRLREVEDLADLTIGQPGGKLEPDQLALALAEAGQVRCQASPLVPLDRFTLGRVDPQVLEAFGRLQVGGGAVAAAVVGDRVAGDREQPGPDPPGVANRGEAGQRPLEYLGSQVLGHMDVADAEADVTVDWREKLTIELDEAAGGVFLACHPDRLAGGDQLHDFEPRTRNRFHYRRRIRVQTMTHLP